jgi:hypothetical protein
VLATVASLALLGGCGDKAQNVVAAALETPANAPTLTAITPNSVELTDTENEFRVVLTGSGFVPGRTTVAVSGNNVDVQSVSVAPGGNSLTATFIIDGSATLGERQVTVTTPNGTSSSKPFTITAERFTALHH